MDDRRYPPRFIFSAESFLEAVLCATEDAVIAKDLNGVIRYWNKGAEKLYGYSPEEAVGQKVSLIFPPERLDEFTRIFEQVRAGKKIEGLNTIRRTKSGDVKNIHLSVIPIQNPQGVLDGAVAIGRDITRRKEIEEQLRESKQLLENFMNHSSVVAFMKDKTGKYVYVNQTAERMFHIKKEKVIGQTDEKFLPAEIAQKIYQDDQIVLETREAREFIESAPTPDGVMRHWLVCKFPFQDSKGESYVGSVAIDVTDREATGKKIRQVIESAVNGILMVARDGTIVLANAAAEKIFGYAREELLAMKIEELIPQRFREKHPGYREEYNRKPVARDMGKGRDLYGLKKDGSDVPLEIGLNPVETDEGTFILASIVDISERKKMQNDKDLILRRVAHDIFNPLMAIRESFVELTKSGEWSSDDIRSFAEIATASMNRLLRLTSNLLLVTKLEDKKVEIKKEKTELLPWVTDVVKRYEKLHKQEKPIAFRVAAKDEGLSVCLDRDLIEEVLLNLLGNAEKATEQGFVRVEYKKTNENGVQFSVIDSGCGFSKEEATNLFNERKKAQEQAPLKASGYGLSICHSIIALHSGKIWAESEPGQGAQIHFTLPA